jgi:hypothetical protein
MVYLNSTLFKILGFDTSDIVSSSNIIIAPYQLNLLGVKRINIFSSNLSTTNYSSTTFYSNKIATIAVDQPSFSMISYSNFSGVKNVLKTKIIDRIDIQITDENNILLDFNNIDWCFTFQLEIVRKYYPVSFASLSQLRDNTIPMKLNNSNEIKPDENLKSIDENLKPIDEIKPEENIDPELNYLMQ